MTTTATSPVERSLHAAGDRFLTGLSVMLIANVLQRVIGLVRNLGFCHFLSDEQLGHWSLANSFFVIAAPIAVLGLPGSFGKFVEIFRRQQALGTYLRSLTIVSAAGLVALSLVMIAMPQRFAWLVFNDATAAGQMFWLVSTLAAVTIFNFVNELMSALRQVRVVSSMQFINSLSFAILGTIGLVWMQSWTILLPAYTLSCIIATLPGLWVLRFVHTVELREQSAMPGMWQRVFPFAVALWCMNLLTNMFDVCDRGLLLHLTPDNELGQALIGQYHCGRLIPSLLISVAALLSGILLPYLSADYESNQRELMAKRMRHVIQLVAILFSVCAAIAVLGSPIMFDWMLGGRYEQAQQILPVALVQCIWMSLFLLAQAYLFCMEKGKQVALILLGGLVINALLNFPFIAWWSLHGSVWATTLASGCILGAVLWRIAREGTPLGWRTVALCYAPAILLLAATR